MGIVETILSLELVKSQIGWDEATVRAQRWWRDLEKINEDRLELVLELANEILRRRRSIDDFFQVYLYSNVDSITENLRFLDLIDQDTPNHNAQNQSLQDRERHLH